MNDLDERLQDYAAQWRASQPPPPGIDVERLRPADHAGWRAPVAAAAVLLLVIVGAVALGLRSKDSAPVTHDPTPTPTPVGTAGPSMTLAPAVRVAPGQDVEVALEGFRKGPVYFSLCSLGVADAIGCQEQLDDVAEADRTGHARITMTFHGHLHTCGGSCRLVATQPEPHGGETLQASARIGFQELYVNLLPVASSSTCAQAIEHWGKNIFLSAFRADRIVGRDASPCLSAKARDSYCDDTCGADAFEASPGPICLVRCGEFRVVDIDIDSQQSHVIRDSRSYYALHVFLRADDGRTHDMYEYLILDIRDGHPLIVNASST